MPTPSYVNQITPQEVTLALEQFLIAPSGTSWTPARIDTAAPPASWIHLGAVARHRRMWRVVRLVRRLCWTDS